MMRIFVVIPAYNEAKFIKDVISNIPEQVEQIIVVDDCSEDGTSDAITSLDNNMIRIKVKK